MPRKSTVPSDTDSIDREIARLQAQRLKVLERQEKGAVDGLIQFMKRIAPERRAGFASDVRKALDTALTKTV